MSFMRILSVIGYAVALMPVAFNLDIILALTEQNNIPDTLVAGLFTLFFFGLSGTFLVLAFKFFEPNIKEQNRELKELQKNGKTLPKTNMKALLITFGLLVAASFTLVMVSRMFFPGIIALPISEILGADFINNEFSTSYKPGQRYFHFEYYAQTLTGDLTRIHGFWVLLSATAFVTWVWLVLILIQSLLSSFSRASAKLRAPFYLFFLPMTLFWAAAWQGEFHYLLPEKGHGIYQNAESYLEFNRDREFSITLADDAWLLPNNQILMIQKKDLFDNARIMNVPGVITPDKEKWVMIYSFVDAKTGDINKTGTLEFLSEAQQEARFAKQMNLIPTESGELFLIDRSFENVLSINSQDNSLSWMTPEAYLERLSITQKMAKGYLNTRGHKNFIPTRAILEIDLIDGRKVLFDLFKESEIETLPRDIRPEKVKARLFREGESRRSRLAFYTKEGWIPEKESDRHIFISASELHEDLDGVLISSLSDMSEDGKVLLTWVDESSKIHWQKELKLFKVPDSMYQETDGRPDLRIERRGDILILDQHNVRGHWGIMAISIANGETLWEYQMPIE